MSSVICCFPTHKSNILKMEAADPKTDATIAMIDQDSKRKCLEAVYNRRDGCHHSCFHQKHGLALAVCKATPH
jgi:hypothetical protein